MLRKLLCTLIIICPTAMATTGSRLVPSGGITGFEGAGGGGITPWALIGGYGSREEIDLQASLQNLNVGEYQLTTVGALAGFYDRFELSVQRQHLAVSSTVISNTFNLLTDGAISTAPGTDITMDVIGVKAHLFGDAIFSPSAWMPQVSAGVMYKKNQNMDTSLALSNGDVPLPGVGVPMVLGAADDSGTDIYLSASKYWLGGAMGNNLLLNVTARWSKANTFGLLGFSSANDDSYELEWEGSLVMQPSPSVAVGVEWRTQSDRLGGLAEEKTVTDIFIAYFPSKSWSVTAAYVDLGSLPFESQAKGFYLSLTGNL